MATQNDAPVRLLAGSGAETAARNSAVRAEHLLEHWLQREPTTDERFAALVPVLIDLLADRSIDEIDAVLRKAYFDVLIGLDAGRVVSARAAEVRYG